MKTSILLFLGCLLTNIYGFSQITFEKNIGGTHNEYEMGMSVAQTADGGYIVAGFTEPLSGSNQRNVYLIKTNEYGDTLWTKSFGSANYAEEGASVAQTIDGGYIVAGHTMASGTGYSDVYLIKTDANGDTSWTRTFGDLGREAGYSVKQTSDNGFIIVGGKRIVCTNNLFAIKTDINGDTLWTKVYGGAYQSTGLSGIQIKDGGYVMVGINQKFGFSNTDIYLIRTNYLGDTIWTRTYGGPNLDIAYTVIQTADSGFILGGTTYNSPDGTWSVLVIKTDFYGDTLWTRTYGKAGTEEGLSMAQVANNGYIITGFSNSYGAGDYNVYLLRIDLNGDTLWTRYFGGLAMDDGRSVATTSDGGFIITGQTQSYCTGLADVYLLKTDSDGIIEDDAGVTEISNDLYLYPSPTSGLVYLQFPEPSMQAKKIEIYDCTGQLQLLKTGFFSEIDLRSLKSGLYYIIVTNSKNQRMTTKIIKE